MARGYEPCMCGDPECSSCGPAQGFSTEPMYCDECGEEFPLDEDMYHHGSRLLCETCHELAKESVCEKCAEHYGDDGVCDEGRPVASPHRRAQP